MKILITTEREFSDRDFGPWIEALNDIGIPINADKLIQDKEFTHENANEYTRVKTTYKIVEEN